MAEYQLFNNMNSPQPPAPLKLRGTGSLCFAKRGKTLHSPFFCLQEKGVRGMST
jgi:hypothetical protein